MRVLRAGSHAEAAPEASMRAARDSRTACSSAKSHIDTLFFTTGLKAPRHYLKEGESSGYSDWRAYAVVGTRSEHRLECRFARAFVPGDQGEMHLKHMDSKRSPVRRATP